MLNYLCISVEKHYKKLLLNTICIKYSIKKQLQK